VRFRGRGDCSEVCLEGGGSRLTVSSSGTNLNSEISRFRSGNFGFTVQRWSFPLILREWESGNGSFSFLRILREWEWEWEWVWAIRKNFAIFFLESLASRRGSLRQKITIFLGVQVSRKWTFFLRKPWRTKTPPLPSLTTVTPNFSHSVSQSQGQPRPFLRYFQQWGQFQTCQKVHSDNERSTGARISWTLGSCATLPVCQFRMLDRRQNEALLCGSSPHSRYWHTTRMGRYAHVLRRD